VFLSEKLSKPRVYETLLFIALLSGPPRLRERDPFSSLSGAVDWSVLLNAAVWSVGAFWVFLNLGGYLIKGRSVPRFGLLHILAFLLAFCLYLSTFTSLAPILTFYRVSQIPIAVLFGFFWVRRFGVDSTLRHLLAGFLTMCIAIVVSAFVAPELVYTEDTILRDTRLRGDSIANTGAVAAMGLVLLLGYPSGIRSRLIKLGMLALVLPLLALAQTRDSYVVVLLFVLLALFRLPRSTGLRAFLYALATSVPVVIMMGWTSTLFAHLVREQRSLSTFSDRLPLWQYTVSEVLDRSPWTGLGFYANRTITTAYNAALGTSHSAYMEIFSGGGILASLVFSVMVVVELFLALRLLLLYGRNPTVFSTVSLLFGTLLIGVTSEEMVISSPTSFAFWILLSLISALTSAAHTQAQGVEIEIREDDSSSSRVLPAARR